MSFWMSFRGSFPNQLAHSKITKNIKNSCGNPPGILNEGSHPLNPLSETRFPSPPGPGGPGGPGASDGEKGGLNRYIYI